MPPASDMLLLIISSPSGAGKTTLCKRLLVEFGDLRFSVSHTTRPPRMTEVSGRDYHFVSREQFMSMVAAGELAEWAEYAGNLYGTSLAEIERASTEGKRGVLFDVEYQGARQLRAVRPDVIGVFILPPSLAELERRLRARATDSDEAIRRRFEIAKREVGHYGLFDYVIVNEDVDTAYGELRAVVMAERAVRWRRAGLAERLLAEGALDKG